MQVLVRTDGQLRCVYDEAIDLRQIGQLRIRRGSTVEPDDSGRWMVDLSMVGGPQLGPFDCRSEALTAERQWLENHWLLTT